MATEQDSSIFTPPAIAVSEAGIRAAKNAALQEALAKEQARMDGEEQKAVAINQDKVLTDATKEVMLPTAAPKAVDGMEKPAKEKLIETADLLPLILGAVMGGVMGGPGGALMGAAGGLYKGQSDRKKTMLDRLRESNDVTSDQNTMDFRERQLAAQQNENNRQFKLDEDYKMGLLKNASDKANIVKDTRTVAQKNFDKAQEMRASGVPEDKIDTFLALSGQEQTDPRIQALIDEQLRQLNSGGAGSPTQPPADEPYIQIP